MMMMMMWLFDVQAMCLQSDSTVLARQQACVLHDHSGCQSNPFVEPSQHLNQCDKVAAASCDVTVTLGGLGGPHAGTCSGSDHVTERQQQNQSADDETTETLRRRLRDTVETCQRLATALDAMHASSTTHDDSQTLPAAKHTVCCVVVHRISAALNPWQTVACSQQWC